MTDDTRLIAKPKENGEYHLVREDGTEKTLCGSPVRRTWETFQEETYIFDPDFPTCGVCRTAEDG